MRRFIAGILLSVLVVTLARPAFAASIPSPVALEATGGDGVIELHWQYGQYGDEPNLDHFRVYRSVDGGATFCLYASVEWTTPGEDPRYTDPAPAASGFTVYYVTAVDIFGHETERSNTAAAYPTSGGVQSPTCDGSGGGTLEPPGAPVLSGQASGGQVSLSWSAPSSGGPEDGYRVYRDGQQVAQTSGTSYSGSYPVDGESHYWYVIAYNAAGDGPESNRVWSSDSGGGDPGGGDSGGGDPGGGDSGGGDSGGDDSGGGDPGGGDPGGGDQDPDAPSDLEATPGPGKITLSWSTRDGLYDGFRVYRNGELYAEVLGYIWTDEAVTPGVPYTYTVTRLYNGKESPPAGPVTATATWPAPGAVAVTGQAVNGSVALQWEPPASGGPVTGYRIYRNGELITETMETSWSGQYQDGYSYTWTVRAYGPGGEGIALQGVVSLVHPVVDYLDNPLPLPPPPAVPIGPGYTPPPAPDLRPVMPQLGQRTGRTLPPVPQLYIPPDIPAPPALPPIEDPADSPWGLPIGQPGTSEPALLPQTPPQPQAPVEADSPRQPQSPGVPSSPLSPASPTSPRAPLTPASPPTPSGPLTPSAPLQPDAARTADQPLTPAAPLTPGPVQTQS